MLPIGRAFSNISMHLGGVEVRLPSLHDTRERKSATSLTQSASENSLALHPGLLPEIMTIRSRLLPLPKMIIQMIATQEKMTARKMFKRKI